MTDLDVAELDSIATSPLAPIGGLDPESSLPTFVGLGLVAIGFLVLAYGWLQVAGTAAVALQMPYVLSAGCTGLGLVITGVFLVGMWAQRQASYERQQQVAQLADVLAALDTPEPS